LEVEDVSWAELGRRLYCHPETATQRAIAALQRLADDGRTIPRADVT
jgi:hypothetical protein